MATTVGSRELKTRLGKYIRRIKEGATIVLTERGHPVGEIRPIRQSGGTVQDRLDRLATLGAVTRGSGEALRPFKPLHCPRGALSSAVLEGRKERV